MWQRLIRDHSQRHPSGFQQIARYSVFVLFVKKLGASSGEGTAGCGARGSSRGVD